MSGTSHGRLVDLVLSLSKVSDWVSPKVADHQVRTAYIACRIGRELGLSDKELSDLLIAGALHDCGAASLAERLACLRFDFEPDERNRHPEIGYRLLKKLDIFSTAAVLVRYHHLPWNDGMGLECGGDAVPLGSHVLHLADRVDALTDRGRPILGHLRSILEAIQGQSGRKFSPELVDILKQLAERESFGLDVVSQSVSLSAMREMNRGGLSCQRLLGPAQLGARIVDFRNRFSAAHSYSMAAVAEALARHAGFSEEECSQMKVAGLLHDVGKLAIPTEVSEKPGKLTEDEWDLIRSHPYLTKRVLESVDDPLIAKWAPFHHERMDGNGYPFHCNRKDLSLGARITAAADVFTALTEDRSHRKGMSGRTATQVMQQMADSMALDPQIVSLLRLHHEEIDSVRTAAAVTESREYEEIMR